MPDPASRPLHVFLCHSSSDKPIVRELYQILNAESWIDVWLDEEKLYPGMVWDLEIEKALEVADAIIVCLSHDSVTKEGYVQRELSYALEIALEKPQGTIFILPMRLDDCNRPRSLRRIQGIDYFPSERREEADARLLHSLKQRAHVLGIPIEISTPTKELITEADRRKLSEQSVRPNFSNIDLDLYRFVEIPSTPEVPYTFWIGKYPVTNAQYERFLQASDYATESYWCGFLKFNNDCIHIGRWGNEGWDYLKEDVYFVRSGKDGPIPPKDEEEKRLPFYWDDHHFGISNPDNPVIGISWYEANAYTNWLVRHWNELAESRANLNLQPRLIRLPLKTEWTIAAGGETPRDGYAWDGPSKATNDADEIVRRANMLESVGHTTPVNAYLRGISPHGVMDMAGNVWEMQANLCSNDKEEDYFDLCGGSWLSAADLGTVSHRFKCGAKIRFDSNIGFRLILVPRG